MTFRSHSASASFRNGLLLSTSAILTCAFLPMKAVAQEVETNAEPAASARTGGLEEIIVTARKRVESNQDVPVAVTALSAEVLEKRGLTNLEQIAASTPQLVIGRAAAGSGASMVMRGIGSNSSSVSIEQSIAVIVDGAYYGQGRIINEGFFDLERAEILKGPQALFFGKNATAGVISLTTKSPSSEPEFVARAGYEFRSQDVSLEAIASGPISDTLGVRLAVMGSKMYGGYFKNRAGDLSPTTYTTTNSATGVRTIHQLVPGERDTPQTEQLLARLTLKWEPSDRFTANVKVSGNMNDANNPAWNWVPFSCPTGTSARNPEVPCERKFNVYNAAFDEQIAGPTRYTNDGDLYNKYRAFQATTNLEYLASEDITLTAMLNYNWNRNQYSCDCDFVVTSQPGNWGVERTSFWAYSTEVRATTNFDGPINLMIGGLYEKSQRRFANGAVGGGLENVDSPDVYLTNAKDSQTKGETVAVFGQVQWDLTDKIDLSAGVRYTHETKDSYFRHRYANPALQALGRFIQGDCVADPSTCIIANDKFSDWSPEFTLRYRPTSNLMLYGAYKTAYKSGGFSNSGIYGASATVEDFAYEPETVKGFEAGFKSELFDRQLRFNMQAFRYKYSNLQVDFFNSPIFAFSTINAGSVITKGIETDFEFAPRALPEITLRGSLNYNHVRYGEFIAPCYAGQSSTLGCFALPNGQLRQDLGGKVPAIAPEWTASLGVSYDTDISSGLKLGLTADARYIDNYLASAFGQPNSRQPSYVNLDASVRLQTTDERWELAVIGKNLTNEFVVNGVYDGPITGSGTGTPNAVPADQIGFVALPRTVQARITWRY